MSELEGWGELQKVKAELERASSAHREAGDYWVQRFKEIEQERDQLAAACAAMREAILIARPYVERARGIGMHRSGSGEDLHAVELALRPDAGREILARLERAEAMQAGAEKSRTKAEGEAFELQRDLTAARARVAELEGALATVTTADPGWSIAQDAARAVLAKDPAAPNSPGMLEGSAGDVTPPDECHHPVKCSSVRLCAVNVYSLRTNMPDVVDEFYRDARDGWISPEVAAKVRALLEEALRGMEWPHTLADIHEALCLLPSAGEGAK